MSRIYSFLNRFNIVRQIPIFSRLNWIDLQKIARKSIVIEYKKGEIIFREGTPPDYFYCLVSGRLRAYSQRADVKENIEFIHRGMHFGIISILTGENHSTSFEAINDSVVLQIEKKEFQEILKSIPQLGIEFSHSLSQRIRSKHEGKKTIFESSIIAVYSPVKGTGSSTYAMNLALNLERETKKKVAYLNVHSQEEEQDTDVGEQASASPRWKLPSVKLNEVIDSSDKFFEGIIKGELPIDMANVLIDTDEGTARKQISPIVTTLVGNYHYVVVDLPNDMDDIVLETLTQSDSVHLLVPDRKSDLELIRKVIDGLEVTLKEKFRVDKIRVIIRPLHPKIYLSFEEINKFIDYDIYAMLPHVQRNDLGDAVNTAHLSFIQCNEHSEYTKTLKRMAREIGGVMVGLVLGGGAALGVAHIGVIRVLEKENIPIDLVIGSSMGALIGAMWTVGNDSHGLEKIAREFEKKISLARLFDVGGIIPPFSGVIAGWSIRRWLRKHLGSRTFYSVKIPFKAVSYNLIRREDVIIDSGLLVEGVMRSIAIPGVIKPVKENDQVLIDGGVLNPLPTNVLASRGIKKIIAVNVLQSPEDCADSFDMDKHHQEKTASIPFYKSPWKYLSYRLGKLLSMPFNPFIPDIIVRTLQATEYVIAEQSAQQADVVIHPDTVGINWFELDKVDDLIKAGEAATKELLPEIKKLVEE